ncbi:N-acetylglucosaminyl-phosphatidylinositol de-N-acetylase-like [Diadema setosum]|uniref:N-acetylglucosaminyl-phosphatidylinositol de-N-acetylase-like n=1 Tax=Diadema setosum TaxID=31175 RepID=UPI003B3B294D
MGNASGSTVDSSESSPQSDPGAFDEINAYSLLALYVFLALVVYLIAVYRRESHRRDEVERAVRRARAGRDRKCRTILFVIAHPDDECMFFAPSILTLNSNPDTVVHILCLSNGNYDGKGCEREKELEGSCAILGISACNVTILNKSELQDDPNVLWDADIVGKHVLHQVVKCDAQMIITFDEDGISNHPNHIAAYRGVRKLVVERKLPSGVRAFSLESIHILRRFVSFLEIPVSFVLSAIRGSKVLVLSPNGVLRAQKAMKAHASQFVWFRRLNIIFSRYLVINSISSITVDSPEVG